MVFVGLTLFECFLCLPEVLVEALPVVEYFLHIDQVLLAVVAQGLFGLCRHVPYFIGLVFPLCHPPYRVGEELHIHALCDQSRGVVLRQAIELSDTYW